MTFEKDKRDPREVRPLDPIYFTRVLVEHIISVLERHGVVNLERDIIILESISAELQFTILHVLRDEGLRTGHEVENLSAAIDSLIHSARGRKGLTPSMPRVLEVIHEFNEASKQRSTHAKADEPETPDDQDR